MAKTVTKLEANRIYGRTNVPARGHVTQTPEGHSRITPSGPGIPAQAHVKWSDDEFTWERLSDIQVHP